MPPELPPPGVGHLTWTLARVAGGPVPYGVLLVAVAAGLIGSAALLAHALNAPSLRAYQQNQACRTGGAEPPDCRVFVAGAVVSDRPLPLGLHAVTLAANGRSTVYYGWAEVYSARVLTPGSEALLIAWHGRAARVVGGGLSLEPLEGPPGTAFLLIVAAIACELVCGAALALQGVAWRLRRRMVPGPHRAPGMDRRLQLAFLGTLAVTLTAGRSGHWIVAAPLHAACGLAAAGLLGAAGTGSARELVAVVRSGLDGLSEERALRLGADVALAAVLVALCLSLASDLVVADVLSLPR